MHAGVLVSYYWWAQQSLPNNTRVYGPFVPFTRVPLPRASSFTTTEPYIHFGNSRYAPYSYSTGFAIGLSMTPVRAFASTHPSVPEEGTPL